MESENTLLTVKQVAEMAHLRPRTIRVKINQGLLRAYKPPRGKRWLIRRADAEEMLTGEQAPQNFPPPFVIDRLGTPEGRARALEMLDSLLEGDEEEQRRAWAVLQHGVTPLSLRPWKPDTDEEIRNADAEREAIA